MEQPDYPAHWEADVLLRDGGAAHLRPIMPGDAERLVAFHDAQSEESVYFRFFAPYPHLSDNDVRRFTNVDHVDRGALVAVIGADIVGVARYDRISATEAEVAFNVADAHQGRGLGSVLLEHIAAAAREQGIVRFVAEVLPSNGRMISIFTDAGYRVRQGLDDGVVNLDFAIAPTASSVRVMRAREHRAEARSIQRLLRPRTVAVIGASRAYQSVGHSLLHNILSYGFTGNVYVVNPGAGEIDGQLAYDAVGDIDGDVDLAVIAVPAEAVPEVVLQCGRKGVRGLVVVSAGFAETGDRGRALQSEVVTNARAYGMRVVGPASFGLVNTDSAVRLNASLAPLVPERGRIGLFSQSGALGITVLENAAQRGLGLSTFLSAGGRADVSGNDVLQYWQDDAATQLVLLYLESVGNPRKFGRLARSIARLKPVVVLKSGRTDHGGALDAAARVSDVPRQAVDDLFEHAGVIRVATVSQMFDVAQLAVTQPLPGGNAVAVVGNSEALRVLTEDALESWGLVVSGSPPPLRPEASAAEFAAALEHVFADDTVDSVVAVFVPPLITPGEDVARVLADAAVRSGKTVVATFLAVRGVPEQLQAPHDPTAPEATAPPAGSVPSYPTPEEAVRALAAYSRYASWRSRPVGTLSELDVDEPVARAAVAQMLAPDATPNLPVKVTDNQASDLLAAYDIGVERRVLVRSRDDAVAAAEELGFPVVLKTMLERLRSRADLADVRLNLADGDAVRRAWDGLARTLGDEAAAEVAVQRMTTAGLPVVVSAVEDRLFGPVVSFGVGGVATEVLGDRAYGMPPMTDTDVAAMIRSLRAYPLLAGYHGAEPADVESLSRLLQRVSRLVEDVPEVSSLVLDPVLVSPVGIGGVSVLRAVVHVAPPRKRADYGPRRLVGS